MRSTRLFPNGSRLGLQGAKARTNSPLTSLVEKAPCAALCRCQAVVDLP